MLAINFRLTNLESILKQGMSVNDFEIQLDFTLLDTC
jgi:hypothetical protein